MVWRGWVREPTWCGGRATGVPSAEELRALVPGVSAILSVAGDRIDGDLLDAAGPGLRVVGLASAGYDSVDRAAAAERGVVVTNTPGVLEETTADLAFALILMARRRLGEAAESLRAGRWTGFAMDHYLGLDVHGASLGIIGYGQIGRAVARRGLGFGMQVRHYSRSARSDEVSQAVDLDTLLRGVRRRVGSHTAGRGDQAPHRGCRARQDETDGHPGEHRTRAGRR